MVWPRLNRGIMRFLAQIKSVSIKETVSNDKEVRVVIITDDVTAVQLQKYIASEPVVVDVNNVK